ncbi:hypothetical protein [Candidatus Thiothrix anitrata]|uniref:Uncharacterized protein n=1 Tax=Candidatus Thiothrix anitrata TaxID=2823902 RepID=A0ABX7WZ28_9GAMM|nr:hypothetical protein [Candidatus Thiothrix anitrata]QTR48984.1 hypothetical protein J8380_11945 [Candidatus Thiothrix anitrata]
MVQHAVANISAQEINHIREPTLQLARSTGIRPGLLPSAETRYGIQAGSPAQLFINHQVNNLIREIQQVRPHFTYNSIRPAGQPYNQHDIDALQQTIAPIRAELLAKLPGVHATLANGMSLGDLNEQVQYRTYLANGGKADFQEWSTEKPLSPEESKLQTDRNVPPRNQEIVQFGKDANQIYHAFRHTDALNLDRQVIQERIQNHLETVSSLIPPGKPSNQIIEIDGYRIQYTAFKLPDGTINIGRIHEVP